MAEKIYRYSITVPSGLEEVALDELREVAPQIQGVNVEPGGRFGQIFFTYKRSPLPLLGLHSASQLAGLLCEMHRITVGRPGLESICARIARLDIESVRSLARSQPDEIDTTAYTLSATLQGRYRFTAAEVMRVVGKVLREKHGLREGQGNRLLRFHLQLTGHRALLGLRLGDGVQANGAVVYCLARLLAMQNGARVLWNRRDPSELAALAALFEPQLLLGILTKERLRGVPSLTNRLVVSGEQWPFRAGLIDYVLGFAIADPANELAELARILRFGGVAIIQIEHFEGYMAILEEGDYPFVVLAILRLQELGRKYRLLVVERLEEFDPDLLQVDFDL